MILYSILFVLLYIPFLIFYPTRVIGRKNLKGTRKKGIIFAVNHQSNADVVLCGLKIYRYQRFTAKKELGKFFLIRWVIKGVGSFMVDRGKPNLELYKKGTALLNDGKALTMFPEGTRKKISSEDMLELKNGLAMFALKTNCLITPVFFEKKPRVFRPNRMHIGQPFKLEGFDKVNKENLALATAQLSQKFDELKQQAATRRIKK